MADDPGPATFAFSIYRGDDRVWTHTFAEDDGTLDDITGWTFEGQYRANPDSDVVLAVDAFDLSAGAAGELRRTLTHVESAKLPSGQVSWDLQATKGDGTVKTYLACTFVVVTGDTSR